MREVLHILFGAVFTVAVSTAMGMLLLRRLSLNLHRLEAVLLGLVAGSGLLSRDGGSAVHGSPGAPRGVPVGRTGSDCMGPCGGKKVSAPGSADLRVTPQIPARWWTPFYVLFGAFFICYFFNALAPEVSPDGSGYHLGNVLRIWKHHGFVWDFHSMYAYLSQGMEMLFLVAFAFGRHSAAALVHFAFLTALPLLMSVLWPPVSDFGRPALCAAILVMPSPVIGMDSVVAYNDLAVATVSFAVFYMLQVWDESRNSNYLFLIGLLAGSAYGIKYSAFLVFPVAAAFVWWRSRKLRGVLLLSIPAAIVVAPWVLRNWIWLGNPFAPFLNAWFPNPYYHAGMEKIYVDSLRHYSESITFGKSLCNSLCAGAW